MTRARWFAAGVLCLLLLLLPCGALLWLHVGYDASERGALLGQALSHWLPGRFFIGAFELHRAKDIGLRDIRIEDPNGVVVARASAIDAVFHWSPLLRGVVDFDPMAVRDAWVRVEERSTGPMGIETAFVDYRPRDPHDTPPPKLSGVTVRLRHVDAHHADLLVRVGKVMVHATDLDLHGADYWLRGDAMALTVRLSCDLTVRSSVLTQTISGLQVEAKDVNYVTAPRYDRVATPHLQVGWPRGQVRAQGRFFRDPNGLRDDQAEATFTMDTAQPLLRDVLPAPMATGLRGTAQGRVTIAKELVGHRASLVVRGKQLAWRHVDVDSLAVRGAFVSGEAQLDDLRLRSGKATLGAHGALAWLGSAFLGRHNIAVDGTQVPLQQWLGPFVARPGFVPEVVTFTASSEGRALWPITAAVAVQGEAWGVPASWLPGVPDPLVLRATAMAHPDLLEIVRLQLGAVHGEQTALQGVLPMSHLGVVDVVTGLRRIPVGPADD